MKILSTTSFIVLVGLICLTQTTFSQKCVEYLNQLNGYEPKIVDCPMVVSSMNKRQAQPTPDNMFVVDFHCFDVDTALCNKVENAFAYAGRYVTATLNLKSPVSVNATFLDL